MESPLLEDVRIARELFLSKYKKEIEKVVVFHEKQDYPWNIQLDKIQIILGEEINPKYYWSGYGYTEEELEYERENMEVIKQPE